jgi:RimJ/RimL family protein N-acetyltransferase
VGIVTRGSWCRVIETDRLFIRKPRLDDADDLLAYVGDPDVMRWVGGAAGDRTLAIATVEKWLARWERDDIGHFSIELDGRVIGRVGFVVWDSRTWEVSSYADAGEHAETELGWTLARSHWGYGYATEAARGARSWGYREQGLERLISLIDPRNVRSIRVADKLGAAAEALVAGPGGAANVWVHPR